MGFVLSIEIHVTIDPDFTKSLVLAAEVSAHNGAISASRNKDDWWSLVFSLLTNHTPRAAFKTR
jgi:hypothetical protein